MLCPPLPLTLQLAQAPRQSQRHQRQLHLLVLLPLPLLANLPMVSASLSIWSPERRTSCFQAATACRGASKMKPLNMRSRACGLCTGCTTLFPGSRWRSVLRLSGLTPLLHAAGSAVNYLPESSTTILESGTKAGTELPAELYGCPYPPTSTGQCKPPAYCNCFDGVCYGSCQGNDLLEGLAG